MQDSCQVDKVIEVIGKVDYQVPNGGGVSNTVNQLEISSTCNSEQLENRMNIETLKNIVNSTNNQPIVEEKKTVEESKNGANNINTKQVTDRKEIEEYKNGVISNNEQLVEEENKMEIEEPKNETISNNEQKGVENRIDESNEGGNTQNSNIQEKLLEGGGDCDNGKLQQSNEKELQEKGEESLIPNEQEDTQTNNRTKELEIKARSIINGVFAKKRKSIITKAQKNMGEEDADTDEALKWQDESEEGERRKKELQPEGSSENSTKKDSNADLNENEIFYEIQDPIIEEENEKEKELKDKYKKMKKRCQKMEEKMKKKKKKISKLEEELTVSRKRKRNPLPDSGDKVEVYYAQTKSHDAGWFAGKVKNVKKSIMNVKFYDGIFPVDVLKERWRWPEEVKKRKRHKTN